ncbi:MAG: response regulator [Anaerolineae bacterium]|nr:response regulator [Anaerolineae bacterium]
MPSGKRVVVVVDDEPNMVDMLSTFLKIKGFNVHGVYSGTEALATITAEKPDIVLLDLMLPDIDGIDVCRRLRANPDFATLPIVMVTARTDPGSVARANQAGANGYLTKPVSLSNLIAEIDRLT